MKQLIPMDEHGIAVSMNYTTANVFLLHGKALREIHVPA